MNRFVTAALAVVGAVAITILPAGPAGAAEPTLNVDQARVDELVSLSAANSTAFAGISLDEARGTVTVRYTNETAARSRLRGVASSGPARGAGRLRVEMMPVTHSLAELEAVRGKVMADTGWQRIAGDVLSEWYVDVTHNVVAVGVTKLSPQLTAAARERFGDLVQLHVAPRPHPMSRSADWSPWAGGIRISSGGFNCTSGFAIEVPGTPASRQMITAGHCFPLGAFVYNNGTYVATVSSRTLTNNGKDVEYLGGTFTPWTYTGPTTVFAGEAIRGTKGSVVGQTFCTNGATSGEVCSGTVTATNICSPFTDGITRCYLDQMEGSVVLSQGGDSGGNVFTRDPDGLKVGGIIIGGNGTNTVFHPVSAVLPMGWRVSVQ